MTTYHIAQTDLDVSRIALGTMTLGGSWDQTPVTQTVRESARVLIEAAVEHGITHVDLADIYTLGKSDEAVGYALAQNPGLRETLVLQQKAGIRLGSDPANGLPTRYDFSFDHLVGTVERSLVRLGTDHVDLLAFHRPDLLAEPEEVARAASHLRDSGKVRHFGVSNHSAAQIELLKTCVDVPLVVNQLELSLLHPYLISGGALVNQTAGVYAHADGLLDYCRLHGILVQAWSPLGGGKLVDPGADAPATVRAAASAVARLAAEKGTTPEAVALAWILRHPAGIQPVVGTRQPARLAAAVEADGLVLDRAEWYGLLAAARGADVP